MTPAHSPAPAGEHDTGEGERGDWHEEGHLGSEAADATDAATLALSLAALGQHPSLVATLVGTEMGTLGGGVAGVGLGRSPRTPPPARCGEEPAAS